MKKIFILYGQQNCGKTKTVKKVFSEVQKKDNVIVENLNSKLRTEIFNIVSLAKIRIGFSSMGDVRKKACDRLAILCRKNCDVIICAARGTQKHSVYSGLKAVAAESNYEIEGIPVEKKGNGFDEALAVKQDIVDRLTVVINELNR